MHILSSLQNNYSKTVLPVWGVIYFFLWLKVTTAVMHKMQCLFGLSFGSDSGDGHHKFWILGQQMQVLRSWTDLQVNMTVSLSDCAEKSYLGILEITLNPTTLEKQVFQDGFLHNNMCEDISQLSTTKCSQLLFTYLNGDDSYAKLTMLNQIEK